MLRELFRRYRVYAVLQGFRLNMVFSVLFFALSLVLNELAILFATEKASNPVTDIILSNTPILDVNNLFVYGTMAAVVVSVLIGLAHPKRIQFTLHTITLFFVIRSIFVSLTHLAPFAPHVADDFGTTVNNAFFGADQFFSAHSGLPFLGALMCWHQPRLRYFFLAISGFFAVVVLLGHIHYSIDVLAAFFITYGIYDIAVWLFPKDYALFHSDL